MDDEPGLFPAVRVAASGDGSVWAAVQHDDPNAEWTAGFTAESAPRRRADVAEVTVGDGLVVAHEGSSRPLALDPVTATVWASLDGTTTLGDLAEDLTAILGGTADQLGSLLRWATRLVELGFLDGPLPPVPPLPRRLHPPVDPEGCVGRRIGLGRATLVELSGPTAGGDVGSLVRIGSTVEPLLAELLDVLPASVTVGEPTAEWIETLVLRATPSRRARTQQIFTTIGDVLYSGRDLDVAAEAFRRTVVGVIDEARSPDAWVEGPILVGPRGVVLLHPGLHSHLLGRLRRPLLDAGVDVAPSTLARIIPGGGGPAVELPPDPVTGAGPLRLAVHRVVLPAVGTDPIEVLRCAAYLLRRWRGTTLTALTSLVDLTSTVVSDRPETELASDLVRIATRP